MFKRTSNIKDRIVTLDIHTTSPDQTVPKREKKKPINSIGEPMHELYDRANRFYLRSRLSRLRKSSSAIV